MKAKFLVIILIILALFVVVRQMLKIEDSIKESNIIKIEVPIASKKVSLLNIVPYEVQKQLATKSKIFFRTSDKYFEVKNKFSLDKSNNSNWEQLFLKGVNLGVALPGKFPSEFSMTENQYYDWLNKISYMNSNVIRIYTIFPPEFYNAFLKFNMENQDRALYLIQGVWATLPSSGNYFQKDYEQSFMAEIQNAIDVTHGNALLYSKPGSAYGAYSSNVSKYVIAMVLGREWESESVAETNKKNIRKRTFLGSFIQVHNANAMEVWLAKMMDFNIAYEIQKYNTQRPISFINWQALDPMVHNAEYRSYGATHDYDANSVDYSKYSETSLFKAGLFAAYHVYPYFPNFVYEESKYKDYVDDQGKNDNYYAYLKDLITNTKGIPFIVAEYGLSSSRGNSRWNPFGFHQGSHTELEQASLSTILTKDIYKSGAAGAIYFEWADEWFKQNWLVMPYEHPSYRRVFWHNMENPEQNYGIMAIESKTKIIDGDLNDWSKKIKDNSTEQIFTSCDAECFYLATYLPNFNFKDSKIKFAIDTYGKKEGEHKLSFLNEEVDRGVEFLLEFDNIGKGTVLVDDYYKLFTTEDSLGKFTKTIENNNGIFVNQRVHLNGESENIFGEYPKPVYYDRSVLKFGKESSLVNNNSDWYWDKKNKVLELRLPWQLLNVSDPSSRRIVFGDSSIQTDGFYITGFIESKKSKQISIIANKKDIFFTWDTWEIPDYSYRLKPVYDSLKEIFSSFSLKKENNIKKNKIKMPSFKIMPFLGGKSSAISLVFEDCIYNQYQNALPLLEEQRFKAEFLLNDYCFESSPSVASDDFGISKRRFAISQIDYLKSLGHYAKKKELLKSNSNSYYSVKMYSKNRPDLVNVKTILDNKNYNWIKFVYKDINDKDVDLFRRELRLFRNTRAWVAPVSRILKYKLQANKIKLISKKETDNLYSLYLKKQSSFIGLPLTIRIKVNGKKVRLNGTLSDGVRKIYKNELLIDLLPGNKMTMEILEK